MTVGLAVWNGRISPVFDVSRQVLLVEMRGEVPAGRRLLLELPVDDPVGKATRLVEHHVHTLICGAVSRPLAALLAAYGLKLIPFIAGEVEEVIAAYAGKSLPDPALAMPGCCGRPGRGRCGSRRRNRPVPPGRLG